MTEDEKEKKGIAVILFVVFLLMGAIGIDLGFKWFGAASLFISFIALLLLVVS